MAPKSKVFKCTFKNCEAVFKRNDRYKNHLRIHTGERPFVCSYEDCNKSYTRSSHLKRHEDTHEFSFRCRIDGCHELLKSKATLQKHVDYVHLQLKPKAYQCTMCNKEFNKHNWLQSHMYEHTGVKPYLCPNEGCERRFRVPSKLKKHMKVHEGYKCTVPDCDETLSTWSFLLKHIRESHPSKYKCPLCEKEFSSSYNLRAHSNVHSEERDVFICPAPDCTKFYFLKRNLKYHIKSYHEVRKFACPKEKCNKAFKSEERLSEHLAVHSRRIKKKKKSKERISFAAKLAGYVPPKRVDKAECVNKPIESEETCDDTSISSPKEVSNNILTPLDFQDVSRNCCDVDTSTVLQVKDSCRSVCEESCEISIAVC